MFNKFAASFIIVTAASAFFFACSSDSNSSGPEDDLSATSSSSVYILIPSSGDPGTEAGMTSSSNETPASSENSDTSSSNEPGDLSSSETQLSSSSVELPSSSETPASSSEALPESSSAIASSSSESPYLWNDEFDTIDTTKWTFEIGTGASGWGNNEKEYYTARNENAYVQDGILHIRAKKESYEGAGYTSARMITKGKFSFTYGTVEARIALPVGKGIWPAFEIDDAQFPNEMLVDYIRVSR